MSKHPASEGLVNRVCGLSYLSCHFSARLAHVVVPTRVLELAPAPPPSPPLTCRPRWQSWKSATTPPPPPKPPPPPPPPPALGEGVFLRGCEPIGAELIARGACDFRPDGALSQYYLSEGDFRVFNLVVGGAAHVRWPTPQRALIGDELLVLIVGTVVDPEHAAVRAKPALAQWLTRTTTDFVYTAEEHAAYAAEREALLTEEASSTPVLREGTELRLTHLHILPTTSTFLWHKGDRHTSMRAKLGLRAGPGVAEHVLAGWIVGRCMREQNSWDGLCTAHIGIAFLEAAQLATKFAPRSV